MRIGTLFLFFAQRNSSSYGYKLYCVCSTNGVIICYNLSQAHHHGINYLHDVKDEFSNCVLIGEKAIKVSHEG